MSKLTKSVLVLLIASTIASVLFLTGIVDVRTLPGFYLAFPLAAILYGVFLISLVLDKEAARFDAEQRAHDQTAMGKHAQDVEFLHGHDRHDHHESIAA